MSFGFLRTVKRSLFSGGFAQPTHRFLQGLSRPHEGIELPPDAYVVNLSFDLELSISTYFWNEDFKNAQRVGESASKNIPHFLKYLSEKRIPFNTQIVGMLLEEDQTISPLMNQVQKEFVNKHPDLFSLCDDVLSTLIESGGELGIHGYSHRLFDDISETEARTEISRTVTLFGERGLPPPTFMAFPRNHEAHTHLLSSFGITSWRGATFLPGKDGRFPRGLWFAPGILAPSDLRKVLRRIKSARKGFLLHLWNHFTEMDIHTFKECVSILEEEGWQFTDVRSFQKMYGKG